MDSKLAGEHYTNSFHECYNLNTTVLRIFNNYGPRAHYEGDSGEVIPRSIVNIIHNNSPIIFGTDFTKIFSIKILQKYLHLCFTIRNKWKTINIGMV